MIGGKVALYKGFELKVTARTFYYNITFWGTAKNKLSFECFKWVVDNFYSLNFEIIDSFTWLSNQSTMV